MKLIKILTVVVCLVLPLASLAVTYPLPANGDQVVGELKTLITQKGDSFSTLAERYGVGYYQLVEANPGVNPDALLISGTILLLPTQYILPDVPREGIVVNLAELRIYFYPKGRNVVMTYPVGIGRQDWETPLGQLTVIERTTNPTWYVPDSIRKARAEEGVNLPKVVPPGPDNPLGDYRLRLSKPTYLIHGTNEPAGVGRRSSSGCLRLYNPDVKELYHLTTNGTRVTIINQPYKSGWGRGKLYLEAHVPLQEHLGKLRLAPESPAVKIVERALKGKSGTINWQLAQEVAKAEQGIPVEIGQVRSE